MICPLGVRESRPVYAGLPRSFCRGSLADNSIYHFLFLEINIPEGLRDVIGKRLSLISKECNQLLSIASVIGRDFPLNVIGKISGLSEEELFTALEEAKKAV